MKKITKQQKLEAFALYILASQHYKKAREFERGVAVILGPTDSLGEYNDFVSDAIYGNDPGEPFDFDEVLKICGVVVINPKKT